MKKVIDSENLLQKGMLHSQETSTRCSLEVYCNNLLLMTHVTAWNNPLQELRGM